MATPNSAKISKLDSPLAEPKCLPKSRGKEPPKKGSKPPAVSNAVKPKKNKGKKNTDLSGSTSEYFSAEESGGDSDVSTTQRAADAMLSENYAELKDLSKTVEALQAQPGETSSSTSTSQQSYAAPDGGTTPPQITQEAQNPPVPPINNLKNTVGCDRFYYWIHETETICSPGKCWYCIDHEGPHFEEVYTADAILEMKNSFDLAYNIDGIQHRVKVKHGMTMAEFASAYEKHVHQLFAPAYIYNVTGWSGTWRSLRFNDKVCVHGYGENMKVVSTDPLICVLRHFSESLLQTWAKNCIDCPKKLDVINKVIRQRGLIVLHNKPQEPLEKKNVSFFEKLMSYVKSFMEDVNQKCSSVVQNLWDLVSNTMVNVGVKLGELITKPITDALCYILGAVGIYVLGVYAGTRVLDIFIKGLIYFNPMFEVFRTKSSYEDQVAIVDYIGFMVSGVVYFWGSVLNMGVINAHRKILAIAGLIKLSGTAIPSAMSLVCAMFQGNILSAILNMFRSSEMEQKELLADIQEFQASMIKPKLSNVKNDLKRCEALMHAIKGVPALKGSYDALILLKAKLLTQENIVMNMVPFHMWIWGKPGLGKSTIVADIVKLEQSNWMEIGCPIQKNEVNGKTYKVNNGDNYWSGYDGEAMEFDDVGSAKDPKGEKYFSKLLSLVSTGVTYLEQASLNDVSIGVKGCVAVSTLVIATSNKRTPSGSYDALVTNPNAYLRRRHIVIHMRLRDNFQKFYKEGENLDFDLIERVHPGFDRATYDHCEFEIMESSSGRIIKTVNYLGLMRELLVRWTEHWSEMEKRTAMNNKKDFNILDQAERAMLSYNDEAGENVFVWSRVVLNEIYEVNCWKNQNKQKPPNDRVLRKMKGLEVATLLELQQYYAIYSFDIKDLSPCFYIYLNDNMLLYFTKAVHDDLRRLMRFTLLKQETALLFSSIRWLGVRKPNLSIASQIAGCSFASMETLRNHAHVYSRADFFPHFSVRNNEFVDRLLVDETNYMDYNDQVDEDDDVLAITPVYEEKKTGDLINPKFIHDVHEETCMEWLWEKLRNIKGFVMEHKYILLGIITALGALYLTLKKVEVMPYVDEGRRFNRSYQANKKFRTGTSGGSDDSDHTDRLHIGRQFKRTLAKMNEDELREWNAQINAANEAWGIYTDQVQIDPQTPKTTADFAASMLGEMLISQGGSTFKGSFILPLSRYMVFPYHYFAGSKMDTDRPYNLVIYMPNDYNKSRPINWEVQFSDLILFMDVKSSGEEIVSDICSLRLPANLAQEARNRKNLFISEKHIDGVGENGNCVLLYGRSGNIVTVKTGNGLEYCVDIDRNYVDSTEPEWARTRGFYSNMRTEAGQCGSLSSYAFAGGEKFIGIHTGSFGHGKIAKTCVVTLEMLEMLEQMSPTKPVRAYNDQVEEVHEIKVEELKPRNLKLPGTVPVVSLVPEDKQTYLPMVNDMCLSIFHEKQNAPWAPPTKYPSVLSRNCPLSARYFEDGNVVRLDPVANNIKGATYGKPLDQGICTTVGQWFRDEMLTLGMEKDARGRILSEHEAINGIPGKMEAICMQTSCGPYLDAVVKDKVPGKYTFIGGDDGNRRITHKALREALDDLLSKAKECVQQDLWKITVADYPKTEKLGMDKILGKKFLNDVEKEPKVRLFQIANTHMLIAFKMYFGAFQMFFEEIKFDFKHAIGMDPMSPDTAKMFEAFKGLKPLDGDYVAFDKVASGDLHEHVLVAINAWYKEFDPDWKVEDDNVRTTLISYVIKCLHQVEDTVYLQTNGIPSGFLLTALWNCCLNWLLLAYVFKKQRRSATAEDWKHVVKCFMGDDNLLGIPPDMAKTFNGITIAETLKKYNIDYTPAAKGESVFNLNKKLEECEFVKHRPKVLDDGVVVLIPMIESIDNAIHYANKTTIRNPAINVQNATELLRKIYFHGEDKYNAYFEAFRDVLKKNNIAGCLPTHKETHDFMLDRFEGVSLLKEFAPKNRKVSLVRLR